MTPTDMVRARSVRNLHLLIQEHLESMRRDSYGLEYAPWKREVDGLWKRTFEHINRMSEGPQKTSLDMITELWTMYVAHYAADRDRI